MTLVRQALSENDAVVLRRRIEQWPAGTRGTIVSVSESVALMEVAEDVSPGRTVDMVQVPLEALTHHPVESPEAPHRNP